MPLANIRTTLDLHLRLSQIEAGHVFVMQIHEKGEPIREFFETNLCRAAHIVMGQSLMPLHH